MPGFARRRVDPEGAALAVAVARAVEKLSWPEVAWMMDAGGADADFEIGGCGRNVGVVADWDMDPWASDTFNTVTVTGVTGGSARTWLHGETAQNPGDTLPDAPPAPVAFDFEALVRRAVVQSGDRIPPRF